MPLADCVEEAGEAALVMGMAFFGMEGSCFLPNEGRAGLALCSPGPLCSSASDLCTHMHQQMKLIVFYSFLLFASVNVLNIWNSQGQISLVLSLPNNIPVLDHFFK